MLEGQNDGNIQGGYTYSGNQGQVFAPAPERKQQVTYVDSMNVGNRYVNNEYMQPGQNVKPAPVNTNSSAQGTGESLSEQIAKAAAEERRNMYSATPFANDAQIAQQAAMEAKATETAEPAPETAESAPVAETFEAAPAENVAEATPVEPVQAVSPVVIPAAENAGNVKAAAPVKEEKPEKEKKEKKPQSVGMKLLVSLGCGVIFGLAAGAMVLLLLKFFPNGFTKQKPNTVVTSENPSELVSELGSEAIGDTGVLVADPTAEYNVVEVRDNMTVSEVAEECMPAIVIINVLVDYNYYGYVQEVSGSGTGVIVGMNSDDLFIVTNYHVVNGAKEISIQFCDSSTASATVKGKKVSHDLAVVTIPLSSLGSSTREAIKLARIGSSDDLVVGESCVAIGNALGYGQSVTAGVISALNREVTTENGEKGFFIQTDAAINPGNSGGALLNMKGELIGINSNKLGGTTVEGMGYAIPIDTARPIIEQLIAKKELEELPEDQQSYFGVGGKTVSSGLVTQDGVKIPVGVYVMSVAPGSPAEKAGIQKGDIITEFDGESVVSTQELMQYLASYPSGTEVTITYRRLEGGAFVTYYAQVVLEGKEPKSGN